MSHAGGLDPHAAGPPSAVPLAMRLGWSHHGFRVANRIYAHLGLVLLLLLPFLFDVNRAVQLGLGRFLPTDRPYLDLRIWMEAAHEYVRNPALDLYAAHPRYLYPPFFLTLVAPLTYLPENVAVAVFQLVKWLALYLSLQLAWRLCSPRGEDLPPIVAIGSLLLTTRFFGNEIANGNINMFMLLVALGAGWLVARERHVAAGLLVAAAACVKITPALLLVYFAYKRCWRTLLGAAVAVPVCLLLFPGLVFGLESNWRNLWGWQAHMLADYLERGEVYSIHLNQSLTAWLNRMFGPGKALEPDVHLAFVVLPPWALMTLRALLSLGILGVLAWACRRRIAAREQPLAFAAEIGLVQIAMLALSGYSWKAHYVALLLPFTVLLAYLADARYPDRARLGVKLALALAVVLCVLTCDIITPTGVNYAEAYGAMLFGGLAAGGGLLGVRAVLDQSAESRSDR